MFGEKTPTLPAVPDKKWMKLRKNLEDIAGHLFWRTRGLESEYREFRSNRLDKRGFKEAALQMGEIRWNEKLATFDQAFNLQFTPDSDNLQAEKTAETEQNQWDRVQESFLRFFVAMLKDYRRFLQNPGSSESNDPVPGDWLQWNQRRSFDREGFLRSQKAEYNPYLSGLTLTQHFDDFITKRLYSPEMPDIIFFDQSIDAKLNRSRLKLKKVDTPFLQSAKAHKVLQTFLAVDPCDAYLESKGPFVYKNWPETLNAQLFGTPRPIPTIITAEFDRQAALISRLRSNHSLGTVESKHLLDFYGSDYDVSPEGMTFTVFFYAYSTVIGREWQAFQRKQTELNTMAHFDGGNHGSMTDDCKLDPNNAAGNIEVEIAKSDRESASMYLGLCDGCPDVDGSAVINDALVYVTTSPCPRQIDEFNIQAQIAFETISKLTENPFPYLQDNAASLLDNDSEFAEYEEARDVAIAQLDLAFDTLKNMETRGLLSDPDIFKSLMEACGRCGDTKKALGLIQMMQRDGLVADREVLSCFMAAFAHTEELPGDLSKGTMMIRGPSSDAYSTFLEKNLLAISRETTGDTVGRGPTSDSDVDYALSDTASSSGSEIAAGQTTSQQHTNLYLLDWFVPRPKPTSVQRAKRRRQRRRKNSLLAGPQQLTDRLLKQIVLGESLLDFLYPDLQIDTEADSCPHCSNLMRIGSIVDGWQPRAFQDFTTCCPQCNHRFVPRFSVSCSAPTFEGSQGVGTPLYCEFLSPWVLRRELSHVIESERGIDLLLDPEWRKGTQVGATIWWNLIALFKHYKLPFSFLLQGSFQNRLINPVPQD